ncbi:MAG: hypothetical protein COS99_00455 [Candidatus Omnitrophica bacterium CG07_land_8_20_14_0_80_42_15]|uniref:Galactosyldiacylglycerol synthase n=1 Tax=Candidatus Aquitaenariimonas noxiae TaxID=1974741 RepID=A0A2J0KVE3_9BACT|nr:MAG: hypothetical protein COS99_00455 [Candidatus Omnitrophica bacterium CG07_land_8_20_14_0_80_42_15]
MQKKVLLMYISNNSGHHASSLAVENALKIKRTDIKILNINGANYTNPILEKVINKTYMGIIKTSPEVWDYLYDNPKVLRSVMALREFMHRYNSRLLKKLLNDFQPDAVACTQAFPCGMVADFKKTCAYESKIQLFGILTDYAPHSYWIYDNIDGYIVPSEETGERLIENGIACERVHDFGIPVDPKFQSPLNRDAIASKLGIDPRMPTVLIMGGSQGLGPIKNIVLGLDSLKNVQFQMIIVAGTNNSLYRHLKRTARHRKKKSVFFSYVDNIEELMEVSSLIITKPGGMTTAEALIKGLPILIVNPLPGQESMNTLYLLKKNVALKAKDYRDVVVLVEALLSNPIKLFQMRALARRYSKPDSAMKTAELILNSIEK